MSGSGCCKELLVSDGLRLEETGLLVGGEAFAGVGNADLYHLVGERCGTDGDGAVLGSEFPRIVTQRVEHEEGECPVCLHRLAGRDNDECLLTAGVGAGACGDDVEELLKGEGFDAQCEFALFKLYPAGEEIVLGIDVLKEFVDIFLTFEALPVGLRALRQAPYLVQETVDEGRDGVDEMHLCTLLGIEMLLSGDLQTHDGAVLLEFFYLLVKIPDKLAVGILRAAQRGTGVSFARRQQLLSPPDKEEEKEEEEEDK